MDLQSGRILKTIVVGSQPEGVTINHSGNLVYVTSAAGNSVSVIDTHSRELVAKISVGIRPRDAAFATDDSRAYVSAELGKTLSIIDGATHRVIHTTDLSDYSDAKPMGIAISPDNRNIYVALGRANKVAVVDAETGHLQRVIPVGARPCGIALNEDGTKLYTANGESNDVSVVSTIMEKVIKTIPAGKGPWGIAITPQTD
jgi:YVTN family beta-propeller protein